MHNVIFTAPILNANAIPTIRAISNVEDTQLSLITQDQQTILPDDVRSKLKGFYQVQDALNEEQLFDMASRIQQSTGKIDRMFASNEQVQVPVAIVRERLGIDGMPSETMRNFRDKSRMKSVLVANDIPCARFNLTNSIADAWSFARKVGYPIIIKPPAGAGAEFTYQVDNDQMLHYVLSRHVPTDAQPLMLEEFMTGDEFSFDSFAVNGKIQWHSLTKYLPAPLEVKRNPWIQWRVVLPREIDEPKFDRIREVAIKSLKVLGAKTGISHMEWFQRPDGDVAISEVGMRPPGAQITTLMSRAHEFDCLHTWANLMITGQFKAPERKYAAGCAYLRGQGNGAVRHVSGLEQIQQELGSLITDYRLPEYGQMPTGTYEGEGFVIVRHPETKVVEDALLHIISNVRVHLG